MKRSEFDELIESLDLRLFSRIESQTSDADRRSLLVCQNALRNEKPEYGFLEIGSFRGGSLQPWYLDPRCTEIYSLDKRPKVAPDERGSGVAYEASTAAMVENLRSLSESALTKLTCLDGDVSEIDRQRITRKVDCCFIDGEHTDEAAWNDFQFCLSVLKGDGIVLFHDAAIVYRGLIRILEFLKDNGYNFQAYFLPDVIFVIEFGSSRLYESERIRHLLLNNFTGYLESLSRNDYYREWYGRPFFKTIRRIKAFFRII